MFELYTTVKLLSHQPVDASTAVQFILKLYHQTQTELLLQLRGAEVRDTSKCTVDMGKRSHSSSSGLQ